MTDQVALERYIGDDWPFGPLTLKHNGVAVDLTGSVVQALVFKSFVAAPVGILTAGAGLTLDPTPTTGRITKIVVPKSVTVGIPAQDRSAKVFSTRVQVQVTDSSGITRTYALILVLPLDPRSDIPPAAP